MSSSCPKCGAYNQSFGPAPWTNCCSCGRPNPAIMPEPAPIFALPPPILPIVVADDVDFRGSAVVVEPLNSYRNAQPGKLLALIPPHQGCDWRMVLRVSEEDALLAEQASHSKTRGELTAERAALAELRKESEKAAEEAKKNAATLQRELTYAQENAKSANAELQTVRETKRKLEVDMGKVRAALGTQGLAAILEENKA